MASRYEMELKVLSARDLKNINWRHGELKPYVVVSINSNDKSSTKIDAGGDTSAYWDETIVIPFSSPIEDSTLFIDVVHAASAGEDTKPLIGAAKLRLSDVGIGERSHHTLKLKRPSGRPQGIVEIKVTVRELRYRSCNSLHAPPYVVPPQTYVAPPPTSSYAASHYAPLPPPPQSYAATYSAPPPLRPYYAAAPTPPSTCGYSNYGQGSFGQPTSGEQTKSKFGMGTGLAVGAVAGILGGLVIGEGIEHLENKIADNVAERVEENLDDEYF